MRIPSTCKAVSLPRPGAMEFIETEVALPRSGEALVEVAWSGICGSDEEILAGTRPSAFVNYPIVPGHEWSGHVVAVSEDGDQDLVGKAVVGEGFRTCQTCASCRRGATNLCQQGYAETGFTLPGSWAEYLTMPTRLLHTLPEGADLRAAAVLEPAACVAEAYLRVAPVPGERVAVVGGGTLGLLATQYVAASSPSELVVVNTRRAAEERALRSGASSLVTLDDFPGDGLLNSFDVVVEAAGSIGSASLACTLARRGGRVVITGIPGEEDALSTQELVSQQLTVHTVFGAPSRAWVYAVQAFVAGILDPSVIVTHELPLEQVGDAFRLLEKRPSSLGKILLHP